ncbi:pyridoxamine 5'-phosphate oxidase family protein [Bradyrhizobium sp. UFLA05-109]
MDISERLRTAIDASVLCWLATVDAEGQPNVSPKEIFCMGEGANEVLVAEIASPVTRRNVSGHPKVCLSAIAGETIRPCKTASGSSNGPTSERHRPVGNESLRRPISRLALLPGASRTR